MPKSLKVINQMNTTLYDLTLIAGVDYKKQFWQQQQ